MVSPEAPFWLPPFDRDAEYVYGAWPQGFTVNGKHPRPGERVDKSDFSARSLREHYEKRWIRPADVAGFPVTRDLTPAAVAVTQPVKRKGGRPKGSKNKPKASAAA